MLKSQQMTTILDIRNQFEKETETHWENSQGEPDIDYVIWLESKLTTKDKPNPFTKPIIDYYFKWYEEKTGLEPDLSKGDTIAAKKIAGYITRLVKKKCANPTEKEIINGVAYILNSYDKWDKFYQGQLKLSQISSNITNIIANIKGTTPNGKSKGEREADAWAAYQNKHK